MNPRLPLAYLWSLIVLSSLVGFAACAPEAIPDVEKSAAQLEGDPATLPNFVTDKARTAIVGSRVMCVIRNTGAIANTGLLRIRIRTDTGLFVGGTRDLAANPLDASGTALVYQIIPGVTAASMGDYRIYCDSNYDRSLPESNYQDNDFVVANRTSDLCGTGTATSDPDCYLATNSRVRDYTLWVNDAAQNPIAWSNWTASQRSDLRRRVYFYLDYLTRHPSTDKTFLASDPLLHETDDILAMGDTVTNLAVFDDNSTEFKTPFTLLSSTFAWRLYVNHVAVTLATEMKRAVPWSILDYDAEGLTLLLDARSILQYHDAGWYPYGGTSGPAQTSSGWFVSHARSQVIPKTTNVVENGRNTVTPMSAIKARNFLVKNNLLKATRLETVSAVIDWSRRLVHLTSSATPAIEQCYFDGYHGSPPLYKVLMGTMSSCFGNSYPRHFTSGCHMTSAVYHYLLRAVNIPANDTVADGMHSSPIFYLPEAEGGKAYMSHGDVPYAGIVDALGVPKPKGSALLLTPTEYQTRAGVVGTNKTSAALQNLRHMATGSALSAYCQDVVDCRSWLAHPDSASDAELLASALWRKLNLGVLTFEEMKAANFWKRMDDHVKANGGCADIGVRLRAQSTACSKDFATSYTCFGESSFPLFRSLQSPDHQCVTCSAAQVQSQCSTSCNSACASACSGPSAVYACGPCQSSCNGQCITSATCLCPDKAASSTEVWCAQSVCHQSCGSQCVTDCVDRYNKSLWQPWAAGSPGCPDCNYWCTKSCSAPSVCGSIVPCLGMCVPQCSAACAAGDSSMCQ